MNDDDAIFALFAMLVLAIVLIYGLIIWAIVWFTISAIIAFVQYRKYLKEARRDFDEAARELGVDFRVDDILHSIGIEVSDNGGFESAADFMVGTPLGITEEWEG